MVLVDSLVRVNVCVCAVFSWGCLEVLITVRMKANQAH